MGKFPTQLDDSVDEICQNCLRLQRPYLFSSAQFNVENNDCLNNIVGIKILWLVFLRNVFWNCTKYVCTMFWFICGSNAKGLILPK